MKMLKQTAARFLVAHLEGETRKWGGKELKFDVAIPAEGGKLLVAFKTEDGEIHLMKLQVIETSTSHP